MMLFRFEPRTDLLDGFEQFFQTPKRWAWPQEEPPVNVWVGEDKATIAAEVPGIDPKEIDISVSGETLTIKGERKAYELKKDEEYHRQERECGSFVRTITLPFRMEAALVEAKVENGILFVTVPRAEDDRPRKISVKVN